MPKNIPGPEDIKRDIRNKLMEHDEQYDLALKVFKELKPYDMTRDEIYILRYGDQEERAELEKKYPGVDDYFENLAEQAILDEIDKVNINKMLLKKLIDMALTETKPIKPFELLIADHKQKKSEYKSGFRWLINGYMAIPDKEGDATFGEGGDTFELKANISDIVETVFKKKIDKWLGYELGFFVTKNGYDAKTIRDPEYHFDEQDYIYTIRMYDASSRKKGRQNYIRTRDKMVYQITRERIK